MSKVPFKVSARAGKLLGRENFSNPEGAIIELVKNSYDADAKNCFVIFDIPLKSIEDSDGNLLQIPDKENSMIYILDNGEGMSEDVIKKHWMQIGTGNKEKEFVSADKRVKTGAKGIGRFALDRLGFATEMWTLSKDSKNSEGSFWKMDWNQFDNPDQSISQIEADLQEQKIDLTKELFKIDSDKSFSKLIDEVSFNNGTLLKISNLKDEWFEDEINDVFKSLEALIPPKELNIPFEVFFTHIQNVNNYGRVETAFFNDFDYKLKAIYNSETLNIDFEITRNELDIKVLSNKYSSVFEQTKPPYDLKTIQAKTFSYSKSIDKILKWKLNTQNRKLLKDVGSFDLTFYYLKFSNSLKEGYPYKRINASERRAVLAKFGGVKVYRDSFRVRPYGDPTNDWLRLGARVAQSPAGAGQRIGDWRVRPEQTAGIITISRKTNPLLVDKSDRGALQENDAFETFKAIIVGVIHEFEYDRTKILNPLFLYFKKEKEINRDKDILAKAEELADKIVKKRKEIEESVYGKSKSKDDLFQKEREEEEKKTYEETIKNTLKSIEEENAQKYNEELVQIRALASLGLIVSSFAHELHEIKNNSIVIKYLKSVYERIIPNEIKTTELYQDGLDYLEIIQNDRNKIKHWIEYSLNSIKKDKRHRKQIIFSQYLKNLKKDWLKLLDDRKIKIEIEDLTLDKEYDFRGFEMDLNTVFGNLINNSIDSFKQLKEIKPKNIKIRVSKVNQNLEFVYSDDGVGLSSVFEDPDEIFLPFTTSKKDRKGNDIGTGLGMYLAKGTIEDYNGTIDVIEKSEGFSIKIILPTRKNNNYEQ